VPSIFAAITEQFYDLIRRSREHNRPRNEAIRTRIGSVSGQIDSSVEDIILAKQRDEIGF
jgi:hypothetical protein